VVSGEACDDGNRVSGDGCSSACLKEALCGGAGAEHEAGGEGGGANGGAAGAFGGGNGGGSSSSEPCLPECGDGIAQAPEECDLGTVQNDGSYGGCTPDCRYASFCGDGVVDAPDEECDDEVNGVPYTSLPEAGCATGCRWPSYCGDGVIDASFGEECDDGAQNGGKRCSTYCTLKFIF